MYLIKKSKFTIIFSSLFIIYFNICLSYFKGETIPNFEILYYYSNNYKYQLWRLITYSFVHINIIHYYSNLIMLIFNLIYFEYNEKIYKIYILFLTSSIIGALGHDIYNNTALVGSSCLCYGVCSNNIIYNIRNIIKYKSDEENQNEAIYVIDAIYLIYNIFANIFIFVELDEDASMHSHLFSSLNGFLIGLLLCNDVKCKFIFILLYLFFFTYMIYLNYLL